MQPDDEADDLRALLHEEYGAPPLSEQFSADLLARLQAEAAPVKALKIAPEAPGRSSPAICLGIATVAALVIAVIWISQLGTPAKNHEVAQPAKTHADQNALLDLSAPVEESLPNDRADNMSLSPQSMSLSRESESLSLSKGLSAKSESESKNYSESRTQRKESLELGESTPAIAEDGRRELLQKPGRRTTYAFLAGGELRAPGAELARVGRIENYIVQNPVQECLWSSAPKCGGLKPAAG